MPSFCLGPYFFWISGSTDHSSLGNTDYLLCGLPGALSLKFNQHSVCAHDVPGIVPSAGSIKRNTPQFWPPSHHWPSLKRGPGSGHCLISGGSPSCSLLTDLRLPEDRQSLKPPSVRSCELRYLSRSISYAVDDLHPLRIFWLFTVSLLFPHNWGADIWMKQKKKIPLCV